MVKQFKAAPEMATGSVLPRKIFKAGREGVTKKKTGEESSPSSQTPLYKKKNHVKNLTRLGQVQGGNEKNPVMLEQLWNRPRRLQHKNVRAPEKPNGAK